MCLYETFLAFIVPKKIYKKTRQMKLYVHDFNEFDKLNC